MNSTTLSGGLIKGLSYNLPIEGAIRMGYMVQRGDKRLPQKDDGFTVTLKHKDRDGWVPHPLDAELRDKYGDPVGGETAARKLRKIPVIVAFDSPDLTVSEQYAAFSREGRPLCRGNGCTARRRDGRTGLVNDEECPGPDLCAFGIENRCDAYVRAVFHIEGQGHEGSLFALRSGSFNAVSDLRATLETSKAMFGHIAGMPMWLTLEAKSSSMSKQSTFWFASLRPRLGSHVETMHAINEFRKKEDDAGLKRDAYESMVVALSANGCMGMAENSEDGDQIEDLVAARFIEQGDDGERRVTVSGPSAVADEIANLTRTLRDGPTRKIPGKGTGEPPAAPAAADGAPKAGAEAAATEPAAQA